MINKIILVLILLVILAVIYKSCQTKETFKIVTTKKKKNKGKNNDDFSKNKVLNGKVIVITGSTRGIGKTLAKKLSELGAKLIIHGRDEKKVQKLEDELRKFNPHVIGIKADLSNEDEVNDMFLKIKKNYPEVYALVNNASSISGSRDLTSKDFKDWKKDMSVNIDSIFLLTNKLVNHMRDNSIKGRVINVSGYTAKSSSSLFNDGGNILSKSFIEKFSDILSEENYIHDIAITTLRIDENINTGAFTNLENIPIYGKKVKKAIEGITKYIAPEPEKLLPVFLYALRAPFHEITGKVISSSAYLSNPKLSKIVPSYQIMLKDNIYNNLHPTKSTNYKDKDVNYLVKQNPYGMSPRVKKMIKDSDLDNKRVNTNSRYIGDLDTMIAKDNNVDKNQITFYRTEYDALKKLVELFVPKYQDILAVYPCWNYLFMLSKEKKVNLKYYTFAINNKNIQPDFKILKSYINQKTKMIYLSSPNTVTGQSINEEDFDEFMKTVPDNIPIIIDQSYLEFSFNKKAVDPLKYLDKNVIVMRTMNNFYGFENLELSYVISDIEIATMLQKSQIIDMPLNKFNEEIALTAYKDKKYNKYVKETMYKERQRLYKIFKENNIQYYPSEVNFILIKANKTRGEIIEELEKEKIIFYASNDVHFTHWTLPISTKKINNKVLQVLTDEI